MGTPFSFVLLALLWAALPQAWAACTLSRAGEQVDVRHVSDGDTLVLANGRKLRLTGVNAPELGDRSRPPQPLAEEARRHVQAFVARSGKIVLQYGPEREDRHGRLLAHVFGVDGSSLEESLLRHGLAWHVVIGPDTRLTPCLAEAELAARDLKAGVWAHHEYSIRRTDAELGAGFQVLRGRVESVSMPRGRSWWIDLDLDVALLIRARDQGRFQGFDLQRLIGQEVEVRGWLVERRDQNRGKRQRSRWLLPLSNPASISTVQKADQVESGGD